MIIAGSLPVDVYAVILVHICYAAGYGSPPRLYTVIFVKSF